MKTQIQARIGLAVGLTLALLAGLAPRAEAATFTWTGTAGNGTWSDPNNWDVGGGAYPSTKSDVAVFNAAATVNYDTGASGTLGAIRNPTDGQSVIITLQKSLLLDYTGTGGSNPTPGSWYTSGKDSGTRPQIVVNNGITLTLNGLYHNGGNFSRFAYFNASGKKQGMVVFTPDAAGKCYFGSYADASSAFRFITGSSAWLDYVDFTQPAEIVVSSASGAGTLGASPEVAISDNTSSANVPSLRIGRTGGQNQVWSATGTGNGLQLSLSPGGMSGSYGPKLLVTASGTEASPNLISFKAGGLSGLNFPDNASSAAGGSWIEATAAGVARLVLEGDFTTADNSNTSNLWNMSQIQLHMAGERSGASTAQILKWCGADRNTAGGNTSSLAGFTNNYAMRKLVIGSDQGTGNNYVTYTNTAGGSAVYTWGLEITSGGYLTIANPSIYLYYLGDNSSAGGITGTGLKLPSGKTLADVCNRPGNVILLGEMKPVEVVALQVDNRAPSGIAPNGATFNGRVGTNGFDSAAVYVAWGQTNGAVSGAWSYTNWWAAGAWTNGSYPSTNMALSANANYYYRFGATNSTTNVMASGVQYLITGEVTVQTTDPTGRVTLADTAAFTVYRPASCTNEAITVAYTLNGTATNGTHYTNSPAAVVTNGTVTIPAGQTNAVITVYPMNLGAPEQTVALTLVSSNYPVGAANSATCTLVAAKTVYNDTAGGNWDSTSTWTPTGYPVSNDLAVVDSHTVTANVSLINSTAPDSITVSAGGTVAHADAVVVASPVTMSGGTWAQSGNGGAAARRLTGPVTVTSGSLLTARRGLQGIWLDGPVSGAGRMTFRAVDGYQGEYQSVYLTAASNTHSGGMVVESNSLSLVAVTNQSLGTGDITVNADGSLWFRQTQDYTGAPRTPIVTLATPSSVVGFQSVDGMTLPFDLVVQGGGKVTAEANRTNEVWAGAVTLNTNLTLAARRNNNVVGFALAGPVSGSGGIVVYADDSYQGDQGVVELRRGTNTYAGGTTIRYGRLKVSADGALGTGPVTVYNSQISDGNGTKGYRTALQLDATPDMNWSLSNSIAGDGTIWVEGGTGSYRLTSSGTVSPGTNSGAVAVLTVDGQFAFAKNGGTPVTLAIDAVNVGTTPGTDHDQLKVDHGDATLAASITNCALVVSLVPSPAALNGMTLTILSATNANFTPYQFASVSALGSGGSVVYSNDSIALTWVAQTPVIQNSSYANLAATSCDVSGTLSSTGDTPTEVRCYWGTNLVDKSGWGYTNVLGTQSVGTVTTSLTNLTGGVTYYYRFYATNGVGEYWSLATSNFTTLADVTWNDATSGNWLANDASTWGQGLNAYPQFPLNDTVIVDSHTVTVTGAQPAVKATWVTRTGSTTGTLYYSDANVQTRNLDLAGGVLQLQSADGGGAKLSNSVIRVSSNSVVNSTGGNFFADMDTRIWSEIRDATNGMGLLTASGDAYVRTRLYGANTNFAGGWRVTVGRGLYAHTEGALGSGTATVDTAIEVMVDHTNTATRPPPARVICNAGGGVYLNNGFPGYDVTVKDWEIELRGGALGFGPDGVGTYRGGHVYVVSNSTFYGRRDGRWGTDSRCEAEIVGTQRVTINANAGGTGSDDGQPMRFVLSGSNTNFSGGIDLRSNQLVAEQTNALGTGPILLASSDSGSGLYLDRPAGNFDWTLANDLSGGRGTNVAIKVEDGAGTSTLTVLGTVDPGTNGVAITTNSTGILRVDGSVAFGAGSRLRIHIAGTNGVAGVDFDRLAVDHNLTGLASATLEVAVNSSLTSDMMVGLTYVVVTNATAFGSARFGTVAWTGPVSGSLQYDDPPGTVRVSFWAGSVFRFK